MLIQHLPGSAFFPQKPVLCQIFPIQPHLGLERLFPPPTVESLRVYSTPFVASLLPCLLLASPPTKVSALEDFAHDLVIVQSGEVSSHSVLQHQVGLQRRAIELIHASVAHSVKSSPVLSQILELRPSQVQHSCM